MALVENSLTGTRTAARPAAPSSTGSGPVAGTRDPRLDFFRGIAMFIILIAHTPGNWFNGWIPARWGFSDATETFVFCSGMASAIAFGRVFREQSLGMGAARVGFRCWQVYWAHIGLFFAIAGTMVALNGLFPEGRDYVGQLNLYPFFNNAQENLFALLTLTYVPNYFDILPMYLVILALMPVMVAAYRLHPGAAIALSVTLWFFAQHRILEALGLGQLALELPAEPWSEREWFFNPFGWQLVFFTGFALMMGWLPRPPVNAALITLASVITIGFIALSNIGVRELGFDWARDWRIENRIWITKTDFGVLRYVHFLATAYLAWVLVGPMGARIQPSDGPGLGARTWRMVLAWIMQVGQQSLAIFITSMYLARLLGVLFDVLGRSYWSMALVNAIGFAVIIGVAYGVGWFKSQPWKVKRAV